jgi:hypothetical protein
MPGNSEGMGETRKKELAVSALQLGLKSKDDVTIIDDSYRTYALNHDTFSNAGVETFPTQ